MKRKLVLPILMSFLITSIPNIALANTAPKCPNSVTKAIRVKTPITKSNNEVNNYISKTLNNSIKSISPTSRKVTGKWWTNGFHQCFFPDSKTISGYEGFTSAPTEVGYQTAIELNKEHFSGGTTILISYYKKNGKWVIVRYGSGP